MRLQVGCIDQDALLLAAIGVQFINDPGEGSHVAPSFPADPEGLVRPMLSSRSKHRSPLLLRKIIPLSTH